MEVAVGEMAGEVDTAAIGEMADTLVVRADDAIDNLVESACAAAGDEADSIGGVELAIDADEAGGIAFGLGAIDFVIDSDRSELTGEVFEDILLILTAIDNKNIIHIERTKKNDGERGMDGGG